MSKVGYFSPFEKESMQTQSSQADLEAAILESIAIFTFTFQIYIQLNQHFTKMSLTFA